MSTAVFGAPEFRARSGRTVSARSDGSVMFDHANAYLSPASVMDAEEFFQAKRDEELGRWRWPENPDYVVMDHGLGFVAILHEPTMQTTAWERSWRDVRSTPDEAGLAYFEAHPERKPWHDAEVGEVWLLTKDGTEGEFAAVVSDPAITFAKSFDAAAIAFRLDDSGIRSGRRIWPEDAS